MARSSWGTLKLVTLAVLAILMIVLIVQNTAPVNTRLIFGTVTMPLAALLSITLLGGGVFGAAVASRLLSTPPEQPAGERARGSNARTRDDASAHEDRQRVSP